MQSKKELFENAILVADYEMKVLEAKHELWAYLQDEHGLTLLDYELDEILIIAQRTLEKLGEIK